MRDNFEKSSPENAVEAVRRATRPVLRRRFYSQAGTAPAGEGFAVRLDDKPVCTPAGRMARRTASIRRKCR